MAFPMHGVFVLRKCQSCLRQHVTTGSKMHLAATAGTHMITVSSGPSKTLLWEVFHDTDRHHGIQ